MEPLSSERAKALIREILKSGNVSVTRHAEREMRSDDLTLVDCVNVLRGGWVESCELEKSTWRYRARTNRICVVVAFRSPSCLVIVTAWRFT